jgi:predicted nucleic acid-binding protein
MPVAVVDASAIGALVFGEPDAEKMAERLLNVRMIAPSLLWFELANVCVKKMKVHPQLKKKLADAFSLARKLPIEIVEVDYQAIVELATKTKLTAYDASYLWLARSTGAALVTLDGLLLKSLK